MTPGQRIKKAQKLAEDNLNSYLDDQQLEGLSFMIASLFDGVPMSQVRPALDRAENILLSGHQVDTKNPRIKAIAEEFGVSELFSAQAGRLLQQ